MRYIGSKVAAIPHIVNLVRERAPRASTLCDPFAGTCTVASQFKKIGFKIITGDLLRASFVLQTTAIGLNFPPNFATLRQSGLIPDSKSMDSATHVISYLNNLRGIRGFVTEGYSNAGKYRRKFFTVQNALRIDAIRSTISRWRKNQLIAAREELFLLAALIEAADRVANTAGTYYAFLKKFTRKARRDLTLRVPRTINNGKRNSTSLADARDVAKAARVDVLYLDPPYNERDYGSYYHLAETLALGDRPKISGLAGVPCIRRQPRSDFCSPSRATEALHKLVQTAQSKYILLHYASKGLISHRDILSLLRERGRTDFRDIMVRGYRTSASMNTSETKVRHRLYWCECRK